MTDDALFPGYDPPTGSPIADPYAGLSADGRRTLRQQIGITNGVHPLTHGPLHPEASSDRTRDSGRTDPFTCGSCVHRQLRGGFPKCHGLGPTALSRSAATDVRAWWPACPTYQPKENPDVPA